MKHLADLLNTCGLAVQNSLYEEGTAANSKRKSEFGDNEVTSTLQVHTSQQTCRLWHSCFCALSFVLVAFHAKSPMVRICFWHCNGMCCQVVLNLSR